MGSSLSDNSVTSVIKSTELKQDLARKQWVEDNVREDFVNVCIKSGHLQTPEEELSLQYPDSDIKFLQSDPYQKEITLHIKNSRKWSFAFSGLNEFLTWKKFLSISMRPLMQQKYSCMNCSASLAFRRIHCHFCGGCFCRNCARFTTTLNFLLYSSEKRICENCIDPINKIKSEESVSFIKKSDTASFMRSSVNPQLSD